LAGLVRTCAAPMAAAGVDVVDVVDDLDEVFIDTFPNPTNRAPGTIAGSVVDVVGDDVDVEAVDVEVGVVIGEVTTTRFPVADRPGRSIP